MIITIRYKDKTQEEIKDIRQIFHSALGNLLLYDSNVQVTKKVPLDTIANIYVKFEKVKNASNT